MSDNTTINIFDKDLRNIIHKEISFITGAWVDFYDDITTGQIKKAQVAQKNEDFSASLELVLSQIADWNLADEKGKLPLIMSSIDRLPVKILNWLSTTQTELLSSQEDKKKEDSTPVDPSA